MLVIFDACLDFLYFSLAFCLICWKLESLIFLLWRSFFTSQNFLMILHCFQLILQLIQAFFQFLHLSIKCLWHTPLMVTQDCYFTVSLVVVQNFSSQQRVFGN